MTLRLSRETENSDCAHLKNVVFFYFIDPTLLRNDLQAFDAH